MTPRIVMFLCALVLAPVPNSVYAAASDPGVIQVQTLTSALLKAMRAGPTASVTERYRELKPVIEQVYGLPLMTRSARVRRSSETLEVYMKDAVHKTRDLGQSL